MQSNIVLPPIGPLFAATASNNPTSSNRASHYQSPPQHATLALLLSEKALRTPTSGYAHAYAHGTFPSSSPMKKDTGVASNMLLLSPKRLASLPLASSASSSSLSDDGSESPTCEDEKLRLSRERNRLHAQRTRIRKRELLESLKTRIHALQSEHGLLKQAFEFHATAVCLLTLGSSGARDDDPALQRLEAVSDAALELFNASATPSTLHADDGDDDAEMLLFDDVASTHHDARCAWHVDNDDNDDDDADNAACTCTADALNSNGKRVHALSTTTPNGSKEEREQLRRERNRLHARRARLRKKLVLERSQQAVQELRKRNEYLRERLAVLITSIYGTSAVTIATNPELCPMP